MESEHTVLGRAILRSGIGFIGHLIRQHATKFDTHVAALGSHLNGRGA